MDIHKTELTLHRTASLQYLLHLPPGAEPGTKTRWPAILSLHGLGESGDDPTEVLKEGLPPHVAQRPDFPFVVIAPQCPRKTWWPELAGEIDQLLAHCLAAYPVDPDRLYLTGLSMGGFGTWYLGARWPDRFAALAPICGGGYWFHGFPEQAAALKSVPVWAFHGAQDDVVPLAFSQELVDVLKAAGGDVRLTVYPKAQHDSWTVTYRNPALYTWFLKHRQTQAD